MEQHRNKADCRSCHQRMDPLGFGLENFDAIGAWRTKEGKFDVDASGQLPSGETFKGPAELKKLLLARKEAFVRNLSRKMLSYALGRGIESHDRPAVEKICRAVADKNYGLRTMVHQVVQSDAFLKRRGEGAKP
jgi:hypothetical protein